MTERRHNRTLFDGLRPLAPLGPVWLAGSAFLLLLARQGAIPHEQLLLDANAYGDIPWYTGMVSNLGVLGWTVGAVMAAFCWWTARIGGRAGAARMMSGGALLTTVLTLDDLFQFHAVAAHQFDVPKQAVVAVYGLLLLAWATENRSELARSPWPLLLAALAAFAVSNLVDKVGGPSSTWLVVEDAAKFLGILAWAAFFTVTTAAVTRSLIIPPPSIDTPSHRSPSTVDDRVPTT
ncbi:MAG: hypothetical protein ACK5RL_19870 [Acidimicrobiales bacterium]